MPNNGGPFATLFPKQPKTLAEIIPKLVAALEALETPQAEARDVRAKYLESVGRYLLALKTHRKCDTWCLQDIQELDGLLRGHAVPAPPGSSCLAACLCSVWQ